MTRLEHPAYGDRAVRRGVPAVTNRRERHLHLVPPPSPHADPCGNALVGAFWGIVFTAAVAGLIALAVWA